MMSLCVAHLPYGNYVGPTCLATVLAFDQSFWSKTLQKLLFGCSLVCG